MNSPASRSYFPHVEGLRGVAALYVFLYHVWQVGVAHAGATLAVLLPLTLYFQDIGLSDTELDLVHGHPIAGQRILDAAPALAAPAALVRGTHEHFDGSGYPDGAAGAAIPLGSRLIAVCVAFAAMTSARGMSPEKALAELYRRAGTQFDPQVVHALATVIQETPPGAPTHPQSDRSRLRSSGPSRPRSVPA